MALFRKTDAFQMDINLQGEKKWEENLNKHGRWGCCCCTTSQKNKKETWTLHFQYYSTMGGFASKWGVAGGARFGRTPPSLSTLR